MATLLEAAKSGEMSKLQRHIAAGAAVSARDENGWSALHLAARGSHADAVSALLAAGADAHAVNTVFGDTPLHCAAAADCLPAARALLAAGASATAANNFGKAPRDKAASGAMRALLGAPAQTGPAGGAGSSALAALRQSRLASAQEAASPPARAPAAPSARPYAAPVAAPPPAPAPSAVRDPVVSAMRAAMHAVATPARDAAAAAKALLRGGAPPPPVATRASPPPASPSPTPPPAASPPPGSPVGGASEEAMAARREARNAARAALRAAAAATTAAATAEANASVAAAGGSPRHGAGGHALSEAELAKERERWGQGSWRREHLRAEDAGERDARAAWEDGQMEAARAAGEAKLAALRRERGLDADAPLPPNVARRDVAPMGARATAEAAKAAAAAAKVQQAQQAAAASRARDTAAAALAAEAALKARALHGAGSDDGPSALERAMAALEAEARAKGTVMPPPPPLPTPMPTPTPTPTPMAPVAPPAAAAAKAAAAAPSGRSRGGSGYEDLRRRREAEAQAARGGESSPAFSTAAAAALRAELEAEVSRQRAAMDAQRGAAAEGAALRPQCNAPAVTWRGETALQVAWTVAPAAEGEPPPECDCFQLQAQPPGARAWANVTESARECSFELQGLVPGTAYTLRVRARGAEAAGGEWGPYSAPALCATSGVRPAMPAREPFALSDDEDAPPAAWDYAAASAWQDASVAAARVPFVMPPAPAMPRLRAGMDAAARRAAVEEALAAVRVTINAVSAAGLPPGEARRAARQLRARYHPDKAAPDERWLFEELSKHVNGETAVFERDAS